MGHVLRAATDDDPSATILSVDGIGAYDHILRSAMLERLATMREVSAVLSFVRLSYGTPSRNSWWDEAGQRRTVTQAEGGEQGDPLMPYLFSIGIQGALEEVAATLQPGEQLCAFLDDIYALCQPDRVKAIYDTLAECLFRVAGTRLHQGKTRVWNRGGVQPADVALLGPDVWEPQGVMVLWTPIGSPAVHSRQITDKNRGGTAFVGGHTLRERFAVWVADTTAKCEPARKPHTPHCSTQFVS